MEGSCGVVRVSLGRWADAHLEGPEVKNTKGERLTFRFVTKGEGEGAKGATDV